jgi:hypothetical protein
MSKKIDEAKTCSVCGTPLSGVDESPAIPGLTESLTNLRPTAWRTILLWKLSSQTVSPKFTMIELFVFRLFLAVIVIGIVSCFAELSSLLQSGAIDHLTVKAFNWGA